jgi:TolA-binding protein
VELNMPDSDMNHVLAEHAAKALPQHLSEQLQQRLLRLEELEERVLELQGRIDELTAANTELSRENKDWEEKARNLDTREKEAQLRDKELTDKAYDLKLREAVLQVREDHAKNRVNEMREVVRDVFSNNRFKYTRTTYGDIVVPGQDEIPNGPGPDGRYYQGQPGTMPEVRPTTTTEMVEGEGDVGPQQ